MSISPLLVVRHLSLFCLFLLITGCASTEQRWHFEELVVDYPSGSMARMFLPSEDPLQGIEVEVLASSSGPRVYLNVFSVPVPGLTGDSSRSTVTLTIDGTAQSFIAERLSGGQRLLLSHGDGLFLLEILHQGTAVQVAVGRYRCTVSGSDYERGYRYFTEGYRPFNRMKRIEQD